MGWKLRGLFRWTEFRVSAALAVLFVILYLVNPSILELFELKAYDTRLRWRGELPTSGEVVIIGIDEKSLDELGQWPWSRIVLAQLIRTLSEAEPRVIGLDIVWPEPEQRLSLLDYLYGRAPAVDALPLLKDLRGRFERVARQNPQMDDFLHNLNRGIDSDEILAASIHAAQRVVLGNFFFMSPDQPADPTPNELYLPPLIDRSQYPVIREGSSPGDPRSDLIKPYRIKGNIAPISQAGEAFGYFNMLPDADGVVRSIPLVMDYKGFLLPPLSLQILRFGGDPSDLVLNLEEFGVAGVRCDGRRVPTSETGFFYINYRGGSGTFPHFSAVDIIKDRVQPEAIRDKIILVGALATGIYDLRVTPLDVVFPGVEIHANIIDNILRGDFIVRSEWSDLVDIAILLLLGFGLGWVYPRLRPVFGAVFMLAAFSGHLYLNTHALITHGQWLNVIYPSILIPLNYLGVTIYRYIHEEREKRMIKGAFQFYVTPAVVNQILQDPDSLRLGGQRRELTALFSDIRGFTSISESLDPEGLVHLLNEYLTEMTNVVFRHDGTLDKYIGDAIMAIYGAPLPQGDHPHRACDTSLDMVSALEALNLQWGNRGSPAVGMGIGINTGEMVVGNMGSERRFDYTVMGDHVNLASRLEGLNKQYGTTIIISEFTFRSVHGHFVCRELDYVRVKGRAAPVRIYELLGAWQDRSDERWIDLFGQALVHYRNQNWGRAIADFEGVLSLKREDPPSVLYLKRCRILQESPPPEPWDGVFEWATK